MIDINRIIELFDKRNDHANKTLYILRESFENETKLWQQIEKTDEDFFYNCKGFDFLADSLQLVDKPERLETFELNDIEKMYRLLVKHYPDNVQYKIDLINFVYNVLDDEEETVALINELRSYLGKHSSYIEDILGQIKA